MRREEKSGTPRPGPRDARGGAGQAPVTEGPQSSQRRHPKTQAQTPCLGQPKPEREQTQKMATQEKGRRARGPSLRYKCGEME
jgi:hypothetical protein